MAITPDGEFVLTGDGDGTHLWHRETATRVWSALKGRRVTSVAVSSDGKTALPVDSAPGALGSSVRLWQLDRRPEHPPTLLTEESQELWAALFAPDDRSFLVLAGDGASVWSVDGTLLEDLQSAPHRLLRCLFLQDGQGRYRRLGQHRAHLERKRRPAHSHHPRQ